MKTKNQYETKKEAMSQVKGFRKLGNETYFKLVRRVGGEGFIRVSAEVCQVLKNRKSTEKVWIVSISA